mmetsp:Transcript_36835/g.92314  ORF Transcript_36835/g.92314 Transcript_36835/m.92314 type:complete len:751 (-) Transcript_36835:144-2396(-)
MAESERAKPPPPSRSKRPALVLCTPSIESIDLLRCHTRSTEGSTEHTPASSTGTSPRKVQQHGDQAPTGSPRLPPSLALPPHTHTAAMSTRSSEGGASNLLFGAVRSTLSSESVIRKDKSERGRKTSKSMSFSPKKYRSTPPTKIGSPTKRPDSPGRAPRPDASEDEPLELLPLPALLADPTLSWLFTLFLSESDCASLLGFYFEALRFCHHFTDVADGRLPQAAETFHQDMASEADRIFQKYFASGPQSLMRFGRGEPYFQYLHRDIQNPHPRIFEGVQRRVFDLLAAPQHRDAFLVRVGLAKDMGALGIMPVGTGAEGMVSSPESAKKQKKREKERERLRDRERSAVEHRLVEQAARSGEHLVALLEGGKEHLLKRVLEDKPQLINYADPKNGRSLLHSVSCHGDASLVRLLHDIGRRSKDHLRATVQDKRGWTPLHEAAKGGHILVIHELLRIGCDAQVLEREGALPLHFFVCSCATPPAGAPESKVFGATFEALIGPQGEGLHQRTLSNGETPLHYACRGKDVHITSALLGMGAEVNSRSFNGNTPLHYAVYQRREDLIRMLLRAGADLTLTGPAGTCQDLMAADPTLFKLLSVQKAPSKKELLPSAEDVNSGAKKLSFLRTHFNHKTFALVPRRLGGEVADEFPTHCESTKKGVKGGGSTSSLNRDLSAAVSEVRKRRVVVDENLAQKICVTLETAALLMDSVEGDEVHAGVVASEKWREIRLYTKNAHDMLQTAFAEWENSPEH